MDMSDCVEAVYEFRKLPNNNAGKHFDTNQSGAKCWLDIYCWDACLAATGTTRGTGQKVLLSAFVTESSNSPVTATLFYLKLSSGGAFVTPLTYPLHGAESFLSS